MTDDLKSSSADVDSANMDSANVDAAEVRKFEEMAQRWWDTSSEFKPLHEINPLRVGYIEERLALSDVSLDRKAVLDVGCGGGILSESLAAGGAIVTGIDMGETPISVARLHQFESGHNIDYRQITVEQLAAEKGPVFDVITCLEMLEHVPDPDSVIRACHSLLKPDGHLFVSTINRNPKSYAMMVLGAEYVLNLLPRGTHNYDKFIKPSELATSLRGNNLHLQDLTGMTYNPFSKTYKLGRDVDVNYLVHATMR
jgi:2-polyprenyl-6-hydroxyphenyl methylase / 3-demethylubiquinone-9 3-methyltransferase